MVTGDHPITAKSIARMVGIISPGNFVCITCYIVIQSLRKVSGIVLVLVRSVIITLRYAQKVFVSKYRSTYCA